MTSAHSPTSQSRSIRSLWVRSSPAHSSRHAPKRSGRSAMLRRLVHKSDAALLSLIAEGRSWRWQSSTTVSAVSHTGWLCASSRRGPRRRGGSGRVPLRMEVSGAVRRHSGAAVQLALDDRAPTGGRSLKHAVRRREVRPKNSRRGAARPPRKQQLYERNDATSARPSS